MKYTLLIALLITGIRANAITCETDSECLSEGISLIKKAAKLGACQDEAKAAATVISDTATPGGELVALEKCVVRAKKAAKVEKRYKKRQERIQKALAVK